MSSRLTPINVLRFEKFLASVGCTFVRQAGSHRVFEKAGLARPVIVPRHCAELPPFIIRNNLRTLGISLEEYQKAIRKLK
ncbi:MAG: type II toxin-antitoxin system HicA family toxin [bacterium]